MLIFPHFTNEGMREGKAVARMRMMVWLWVDDMVLVVFAVRRSKKKSTCIKDCVFFLSRHQLAFFLVGHRIMCKVYHREKGKQDHCQGKQKIDTMELKDRI